MRPFHGDPVKAHTAQLAGGARNADRVLVADHAVIVLDGATAFEPVAVDPAAYAETLGAAIAEELAREADAPLAAVVAAAISQTAARLDLAPGRSPSSTVTILRTREDAADLYVLGDSPIHYGTDQTAITFTDDRLAAVAPDEQAHYVSRLRSGHGYDDDHHAALVMLQRAQRMARNKPNGYWIAEADPAAARHAITRAFAPSEITWAVLATDGAAEYIDYHGLPWSAIARHDGERLAALLRRISEWEADTDSDGKALARPKRHDDKTLVAIPAIW